MIHSLSLSGRSLASGLFVVFASLTVTGCAATATFYSRNGRAYPPLSSKAIVCDENEARAVAAAGADIIGSIAAKGLRVDANDDDVAEKAASVAAEKGGTHVVLTDKGVDYFVVTQPGKRDTRCVDERNHLDCQTAWTPPTSTTYAKPTARFVVLRVARENWEKLPADLKPLASK